MDQHIIPHATTDKAFLYARQSIHSLIYIEERCVVGIEVGAYLGV